LQLIKRFQKLYIDLQKKILELEAEITVLRQDNLILKQENANLKERLGLNSKNSSIPSSKELYKIKSDNKTKSLLKQGAQVGHKGHVRNKPTQDEIFKIALLDTECEWVEQ
jgi:transposase